jgi:hypothetical protein
MGLVRVAEREHRANTEALSDDVLKFISGLELFRPSCWVPIWALVIGLILTDLGGRGVALGMRPLSDKPAKRFLAWRHFLHRPSAQAQRPSYLAHFHRGDP